MMEEYSSQAIFYILDRKNNFFSVIIYILDRKNEIPIEEFYLSIDPFEMTRKLIEIFF